MRVWIILFVAQVLVVVAWRLAKAGATPEAGSMAPDFSLPSQDGSHIGIKDFRGKWVVLYFYPKDFTSGCTVEAHNFQRDQAQYEAKNAAIVGVSMQDPDSHQKFCTKEGLTFKLLADTDSQVSSTYDSVMNMGVTKLSARHTFLIDPNGVVQKVWLDVKPDKHSTEVLAALDDLQKNGTGK